MNGYIEILQGWCEARTTPHRVRPWRANSRPYSRSRWNCVTCKPGGWAMHTCTHHMMRCALHPRMPRHGHAWQILLMAGLPGSGPSGRAALCSPAKATQQRPGQAHVSGGLNAAAAGVPAVAPEADGGAWPTAPQQQPAETGRHVHGRQSVTWCGTRIACHPNEPCHLLHLESR